MVSAAIWIPVVRRPVVWWVILAVGVIGLATMFGIDYAQYTSDGNPYSLNRTLYSLITLTDVPLIALIVGWFFGVITSRVFRGEKTVAETSRPEVESSDAMIKTT